MPNAPTDASVYDITAGTSGFLYSRQFKRSWAKTIFGIYLGTGLGFAFAVFLGKKAVGPSEPYVTAIHVLLAAFVFLAFARLFRTFTRPSLCSLFLSQPVLEIRDDGILLRSWSRHLIPWVWIEKAIYPVYVWPVGLGPFRDCLVLKLKRPKKFRDRKHFPFLLLQNLVLFWSPYRYLWVFDTGLGPVFDKFMAINQYRDRRNRNRRAPVLKADLDQGLASIDTSSPIPESAPAADSEDDEPPREFNLPVENSLYQGLAKYGASLFAKVESLTKESGEPPPRIFNLRVKRCFYYGTSFISPPLIALYGTVNISVTGKPPGDFLAFGLALSAYVYCMLTYYWFAAGLNQAGTKDPLVNLRRDGLQLSFYTEKPIPWSLVDRAVPSFIPASPVTFLFMGFVLNIQGERLAELGYPTEWRATKRSRRRNQYEFQWLELFVSQTPDPKEAVIQHNGWLARFLARTESAQEFEKAVKYYKEKYGGDEDSSQPD